MSETGLVYTFTTAKLQPLVTQPEGKNLIQACLNAPAGQIPTGAPIGQPGNSVHQPNLHAHPHPHQQPPPAHSHVQQPSAGGVGGVPHPASGVAQGLPPPTAMPPPQRNMPGGLSIGDKRGGGGGRDDDEMEDDDDDDEGGEGSPSEDLNSPLNARGGQQGHMGHPMPGGPNQRSPPVPGGAMQPQRHAARSGAAAAASHSARGAHQGVHPYAAGGGSTREGHRRRTSSSNNPTGGPGGPTGGGGGKVTSPRMGMQRQQSGMGDGSGMDTQSPTIPHYPGHDQGPGGGMYGYQQQGPGPAQGQGYPGQPPPGWGQPGVHPGHRR